MKTAIIILTLIALAVGFACKKSNNTTGSNYTPDCSGTTPKFSSTISPLVLSSCAGSGCHNSGSQQGPGALTTYAQIKSASSSIRSAVVSGSMPQNTTLAAAQKNSIVCWIDAGANND